MVNTIGRLLFWLVVPWVLGFVGVAGWWIWLGAISALEARGWEALGELLRQGSVWFFGLSILVAYRATWEGLMAALEERDQVAPRRFMR